MADKVQIIVPIKVAGKLIGYDIERMEAIRTPDTILTFDLANADAHFAKFVNAQGKDKNAPAYNLLANYILEDDKAAFESRLKGDKAAVMSTMAEVLEIVIPNAEKVVKNFLPLSI